MNRLNNRWTKPMWKVMAAVWIAGLMAGISAAAETFYLEDEPLDFQIKPVMVENRNMVSVRELAERMGCVVTWDDETRTAAVQNARHTALFTIEQNTYTLDGMPRAMDVAPVIVEDRTMFPARFVAEAMGAVVDWDEVTGDVRMHGFPRCHVLETNGYFGPVRISYEEQDSWFGGNENTYNPELAALSAAAVMAVENPQSAQTFLEQIGFGGLAFYDHNISTVASEDIHRVNYVIGLKDCGDFSVASIMVKGTEGTQWYSNMDLYPSADTPSDIHYGFELAARELTENLESYLARSAPNKPVKLWFAGHSRGGAAVNLAAAYEKQKQNGARTVFAYTFAAPNVARSSALQEMDGIFNLVNDNDIVSAIPLTGPGWDYGRYGRNITIVTAGEEGERLRKEFALLTGRPFRGVDSAALRQILEVLMQTVPEAADYYASVQGRRSPYSFFHDRMVPMILGTDMSGALDIFDPVYGPIAAFFVDNGAGDLLADTEDEYAGDAHKGIFFEHTAETYYCSLRP